MKSRTEYLLFKFAVAAFLSSSLIDSTPAWASSEPTELSEAETSELIVRSLGLLGVEYRFGGSTPAGGLDCSGFVRHVYKEALGLTLPRTSDEMSTVGEAVDRRRLRAGDLVFFNTLQRPFSHVGLYLGDDRFVHAPSTGNVIRVEPLSARYWAQRFEGGRRISPSSEFLAQDRTGLDQLISSRGGQVAALSPKAPQTVSPRSRDSRAAEYRTDPRSGSSLSVGSSAGSSAGPFAGSSSIISNH